MEILHYSELPCDILEGIQAVHRAVFEGSILKEEKLSTKQKLLVLVAVEAGQIAGFKMGYEEEDGVFYSWLGGVDPAFQQRGIARQLMDAQHQELLKRGYTKVRTISRNNRRAMLLLNIKSGFDIIDTFIDAKGRHKIRLEKAL